MKVVNVIFTIIVGMLAVPLVRSFISDMMPSIEEHGTVPEISMWKLMPLLILICIFIASIVNLTKSRRGKE